MASILQRLSRPFSSSTMRFSGDSAAANIPDTASRAIIAGGCFWGTEHLYKRHFDPKDPKSGVYAAEVGYVGGQKENPKYREVCNGDTGHAEAVLVAFNPDVVSYRTLIEFFYKVHDPTTLNRQGADQGTQYRSGIYYENDEQKQIAEDVTKKANEQWWHGKITTEIVPAGKWYKAEEYHQDYLNNNPGGYECPLHYVRKFPDLD